MINALVAPLAVRAPLALRKSAKTGSKTRAAAVAPKIVTASSNAPIGGDKKKGARGEEAFRLQALGKNPIVNAAAGAMDVIPGDYRIGGVLLGVATFLFSSFFFLAFFIVIVVFTFFSFTLFSFFLK